MRDTILVIDDDIDFINILKHRVEKMDLKIVTHENGDLINKMFENDEIFLVILDMKFYDEMRGLKYVDILRKKYSQNIPIAVVSAVRSPDVITKALEYGASEYLTKPFLRHQFYDLIDKYLKVDPNTTQMPSMTKIRKEVQTAEISVNLKVVEIFANGFTFNSNFMITKGTQLKLSSPLIEEIFTVDHIYLYVVKNELIDEDNNIFTIEAEIDRYDFRKNEQLREWLNKMKSRNLK